LNIVVADDLDALGSRKSRKWPSIGVTRAEGAGLLLVIEDETEVAARICALIPFLPA
jgi:hypothetical protein